MSHSALHIDSVPEDAPLSDCVPQSPSKITITIADILKGLKSNPPTFVTQQRELGRRQSSIWKQGYYHDVYHVTHDEDGNKILGDHAGFVKCMWTAGCPKFYRKSSSNGNLMGHLRTIHQWVDPKPSTPLSLKKKVDAASSANNSAKKLSMKAIKTYVFSIYIHYSKGIK